MCSLISGVMPCPVSVTSRQAKLAGSSWLFSAFPGMNSSRVVMVKTPPSGIATRDEFMPGNRSEEHTSELQSHLNLVCRLLLEKKKNHTPARYIAPLRSGA